MSSKTSTVTGAFDRRVDADQAVTRLHQAGFPQSAISLLVSDKTKAAIIGEGTAEGAGVGSAIGGVLGGLLGGLAVVGAIAIPGVGLLAVGPIVAALAGAGAGGAAGGLIGGLVGLGLSASDAEEVQRRLAAGAIIVAVQIQPQQAQSAVGILRGEGGHQVHQHA